MLTEQGEPVSSSLSFEDIERAQPAVAEVDPTFSEVVGEFGQGPHSAAVAPEPRSGWRREIKEPSLPEHHARIAVANKNASIWRKLTSFSGVGFLISVGYMDPGNWATDIAGGASFGYDLLFIK